MTAHGTNPADLEALRELAAVGSSSAAAALGDLLGCAVAPGPSELRTPSEFSGIAVVFGTEGDLEGLLAIELPPPTLERAARALLGHIDSTTPPGRLDSAVRELCNIVASAMVSAIADTLAARILITVPTLVWDAQAGGLGAHFARRDAGPCIESALTSDYGRCARVFLAPRVKPEPA